MTFKVLLMHSSNRRCIHCLSCITRTCMQSYSPTSRIFWQKTSQANTGLWHQVIFSYHHLIDHLTTVDEAHAAQARDKHGCGFIGLGSTLDDLEDRFHDLFGGDLGKDVVEDISARRRCEALEKKCSEPKKENNLTCF